PEDRRGRDSPARQLAREVDGVERLDEGEQGPGEEPLLLAGGDGNRAPLRQLARETGRLRPAAAKGALGKPRPRAASQKLAAALGPGLHRRRIRIEVGKAAQEIAEERRETRKLLVGDHAADSGLRASTMSRGESGPAGVSSKPPQIDSIDSPAPRKSATSSEAV